MWPQWDQVVLKAKESVDGFGLLLWVSLTSGSCSLSLPRGLFSESSGSSSSEIRRSSSTVEHLEKADISILSLNVKSSRYTKGHFGSSEPHQPEQTSAFRFDFTPTKILYYLVCARSHLKAFWFCLSRFSSVKPPLSDFLPFIHFEIDIPVLFLNWSSITF